MLNLNNVPQDQSSQKQEFSLIPKGTIARAVIIVKQGDIEIPEFGNGPWFKKSRNTSAKWMELEFTIIGGEFDLGHQLYFQLKILLDQLLRLQLDQ